MNTRAKKLWSCLFLMLFLLSSCSKNAPESTVKTFLDSTIKMDIKNATDCLNRDKNSSDFINSIFIFEDDYQMELAGKTFSKMEYNISSIEDIEKDYKKAIVTIKHIDFLKMTEEVVPKLMEGDLQNSSDEAMDKMVKEYFSKTLSDSNTPMMDSNIEIVLYKSNGKWLIIPDEELLNAISGNMIMAYQLIGESIPTQ